MDYKKIFAMKKSREDRIEKVCPGIPYESGIYVFYRNSDDNTVRFYCGQARKLRERCGSHLAEYDHIALSLKSHGFYSEENPYGWKLIYKTCSVDKLDENERLSIQFYIDKGWIPYNITAGGQNKGKIDINERKPSKTYTEGKEAEKKRISKELSHLFELHLDVTTKKNPPTVNQQKALQKFKDFLEYHKNET